jgi:hypothetical protein
MFSGMDQGKYVRHTAEQVEALERLYHDCPKPVHRGEEGNKQYFFFTHINIY